MPNIRRMGRKIRDWDPEDMAKAVAEVRAGRLSLRAAAAQFRVTKSSLNERVTGRVAFGCLYEQKPLLSSADENALVYYCLYCARYGFTLTKPQILVSALDLYNQRHPEAPKKTLGVTWWINFRERHLEQLTTPIPDIIDEGPGTADVIDLEKEECVKREPIEDYFRLLQNTIDELGLREKSQQIYSCDETVFPLGSVRQNVQWTKKSKMTLSTRDHITVLACFNAAGKDVPPLIIYKGEYPGGPYNKDGVPNTLFEKSQTGNIDAELFHKWFTQHFLKYASKERPLLMVMDGHKSLLGPEVVQAAQTEGIIFLGLPPHSSHILQPLDEHFFDPLKANFPVMSYERSGSSRSFLVFKRDFSQVLKLPYQTVKKRGTVVAGFRKCGLFPLDPDAIDWSQVTTSRPQHKKPPPAQLHLQSTHVQTIERPKKRRVKQKEEQLPEFSAVCAKNEESSEPDVQVLWSLEPSLKQEIPETSQIKEEQSVKQEKEQLSPFTETSPEADNIIITNVVSLSDVGEEHNF